MNYKEYSLHLWSNKQTTCLPEWQVVWCFYAAVHATNHFCYGSSKAPQTHGAHEKNLENKNFPFLVEYGELREFSEQVRYHPNLYPISQEKIDTAEKLAKAILTVCNII